MSDEPELPHGLALAWGIAANPQRGPKREMSVERIVETAIEIADEGGLSAVSMASVAGRLGFTPMSLYRYVSAKDDLVLLMVEQANGVPPETIAEAEGWRAGLAAFAAANLEMFAAHPWVLDVPIEGTPVTPNSLAWLDAALATLRATPLDYEEKVSVTLAVMAQARFEGIITRGYRAAAEAAGGMVDDLDARADELLARLITPEAYPEVHPALLAGVFGPGVENPFAFGLERVLDGVEAYVAARPAGPVERSEPAASAAVDEAVERDPKVREARKARREVEKALRDARKREREARRAARERLGGAAS